MKILHVNDVASVASILVRASGGRDGLFQPTLRRDLGEGTLRGRALGFYRVRDAWRMRQHFVREGFTHLHIHYATFVFLADLARLPYSLHVHGGDVLLDLDHPMKRRLVLRALRRARKVVVSTPDLIEPTRRLGAEPLYVPNPMELPSPGSALATEGQLKVIVLSKMDRLKGWPDQVRLLESLAQAHPGLAFTFFAHGQLPDQERHDMATRLQAIGGTITPSLTRAAFLDNLLHHQIALGQLEVGSLGMSEMEAMARGLPVIASAFAHRQVGMHPPVIAPEDAADLIREFRRDGKSALERRGEASRAYIREQHDPSRSLGVLERHLGGVS